MTAPALQDTSPLATPTVPVRLIEANPDNPRAHIDVSAEMVASVRSYGILLPLVVEPVGDGDDGWRLIDGHRRLAAAVEAGLERVPVAVREAAPAETAIEMMLVANLHRQDLTAVEEAGGFQALITLGRTQAQVAEMVGVSQSHVSKRLGLLKLPEVAQEAAVKGRDSGGISIDEATALAALPKGKVEALFKRKAQPEPWQVKEAVADHLHEKARAKSLAELKKAGVTVVDRLSTWEGAGGPVQLAALHWVDKHEHLAAAKCRVVQVNHQGQVVEGCAQPKSHPRPAEKAPAMANGQKAPARPKESAEQKAERERFQRRYELRRAGISRRKAFVVDILDGHVKPGDAVAFASYLLTANDGYEVDVSAALELMAAPVDDTTPDPILVRSMIVADQANGAKFLMAVGLDIALAVLADEVDEGRAVDDPAGEPARFALAWLESKGYELDELEKELLYGATKEEEERVAAE